MPTTTVRIEGVDELVKKLKNLRGVAAAGVLEEAAMAGAEVIRSAAAGNAPGPHIVTEVMKSGSSSAQVGIGPDAAHWYYQFFETGAGPHGIDPTKKKALAFTGREGEIVRGKVSHPGMAAKPFLRPAMDSQKDAAIAEVARVLRAALDRVAAGGSVGGGGGGGRRPSGGPNLRGTLGKLAKPAGVKVKAPRAKLPSLPRLPKARAPRVGGGAAGKVLGKLK